MRHDPAGAAIVIMMRSLKMPGMAQAVQDLHEQGSPAFDAAIPILSQLLKAEMAEREVRSVAYHMKAARFPAYKDLSGFDFAASEVREALVRQLHRCEFMDAAENVVLIGGPGTGKSHVATALGIQAIEHHRKRVRFFCKHSRRAVWLLSGQNVYRVSLWTHTKTLAVFKFCRSLIPAVVGVGRMTRKSASLRKVMAVA